MATVYVVDDDGFVARIYAAILQEEGHEVRCFTAVARAIEAMKLPPVPDLVVTDLVMPEMDGVDLARAIKVDESLRHIPILLYSASLGRVPQEERHLFTGIYQKPLSPADVAGSVGAALLPLADASAVP